MGNKMPGWFNRECGGRVGKADGGWTGEGDSGKRLREKADEADREAKGELTKGYAKAALGAAMTGFSKTKVGKLIGALPLAAGGADALTGLERSTAARRGYEAADKAEGRKRGGKVKKGKR